VRARGRQVAVRHAVRGKNHDSWMHQRAGARPRG
jgi:hypothetical protein